MGRTHIPSVLLFALGALASLRVTPRNNEVEVTWEAPTDQQWGTLEILMLEGAVGAAYNVSEASVYLTVRSALDPDVSGWFRYTNVKNGLRYHAFMRIDGTIAATANAIPCVFPSLLSAPLVVCYLVYALFFVACGGFHVWKNGWHITQQLQNKKGVELSNDELLPHQVTETSQEVNSTQQDQDSCAQQRGYVSCWLGNGVQFYGLVLTFFFPILFLPSIIDFYGSSTRLPRALFGWHRLTVFMMCWHACALWSLVLATRASRIRAFFLLPAVLSNASIVALSHSTTAERLTADRGHILVRWYLAVERCLTSCCGGAGDTEDHELQPVRLLPDGARYIEFQYSRLLWTEASQRFERGRVELGNTKGAVADHSAGLTTAEAEERLLLVGPNEIPIRVPGWLRTAATELSGKFYVYQFVAYWVWFYWGYWQMGLVNMFAVLLAAVIAVAARREGSVALAGVTGTHSRVRVRTLRSGNWADIEANNLVPGDAFEVPVSVAVPCDAALVQGFCVVDESNLTGESLPHRKFALRDAADTQESADDPFTLDRPDCRRHVLYAGTTVLQSENDQCGEKKGAVAVVLSTGMGTSKGHLVQRLMWPPRLVFKFNEHLPPVMVLLVLTSILHSTVAIIIVLTRWPGYDPPHTVWLDSIFSIMQFVQPLIPAMLVVGQSAAARRLRKLHGIYSLDPQRVAVAGKVRICCFDKTGTLTTSGLDFAGVVPTAQINGVSSFATPGPLPADVLAQMCQRQAISMETQWLLASCHSLAVYGGDLVGSQVERSMFSASRWSFAPDTPPGTLCALVPPCDGGDALHVLRRFDFDHRLMAMSAIVRHTKSNRVFVFVKGSYERLQSRCIPESLPGDYATKGSQLATQGYYVLGIGWKEVSPEWVGSCTREETESDIVCLGLLLFRNEPKPEAARAISELRAGDCRCVMITGDSASTGVSIAQRIGLLGPGAVILLHADMSTRKLQWHKQNGFDFAGIDEPAALATLSAPETEVIMTGDAFRLLGATGLMAPPDFSSTVIPMLGTTSAAQAPLTLTAAHPTPLLLRTRVFARMSPEDKVQCVRLHMALGFVTAMCGDGGNDCGALRVAHVGLAFSDAEASLVSPFSSHNAQVTDLVRLLAEGRCALATSFASFNYLVLYGFVLNAYRVLGNAYYAYMSMWDWIYVDSALVFSLSLGLAAAKPRSTLDSRRPTASLLAPQQIAAVVGQSFVNLSFMIGTALWFTTRPWYVPFDIANLADASAWWLLSHNHASAMFGTIVLSQMVGSALSFSLGGRFREPNYRNRPLMASIAFHLIFIVVLGIPNGSPLARLFEYGSDPAVVDPPVPQSARVGLLCIAAANNLVNLLWQRYFVIGPVGEVVRRKNRRTIPLQL